MISNELPVIAETPIELRINDNKLSTFMCTPYNLEELALGHLITRGVVKSIKDIDDIKVKANTGQVFVKTKVTPEKELYSVPEFVVSGSSSVSEFTEDIYKIPRVNDDYKVDLKLIQDMSNKLSTEAVIYNTTGGVHGSLIWSEGDLILREDIGRHCAIDKAVGGALKRDFDLKNSFICTTGRISLEMLLKAAAVGIPVVVSFKYPSDMGVKLANHYNITIVARSLTDEPLIYGNTDKIKK